MNHIPEPDADIDASEHYHTEKEKVPSLLTVILDTNPRAWSALSRTLPFDKAVANILVFLNSHLSYNSLHEVAVIASHPSCATWLYPSPPRPPRPPPPPQARASSSSDEAEVRHASSASASTSSSTTIPTGSGDKYTIYGQVQSAVLDSLRRLDDSTTVEDMHSTDTHMSGALTLALSYINKANTLLLANIAGADSGHSAERAGTTTMHALSARMLVISVSDASPSQYIATMNAVFAAAHADVSIDVLALRGDTASSQKPITSEAAAAAAPAPNGVSTAAAADGGVSGRTTFLQQAADLTGGTYLSVPNAVDAAGLLTFLMFGFADSEGRASLVAPTQDTVDFRAACFCHRRVVATGFVCSICLSIFCCIPNNNNDAASEKKGGKDIMTSTPTATATATASAGGNVVECLTCGSDLVLGFYGDKPAVVPRRKRKRKRGVNGAGREESGSVAGTPRPG